MVAVAKMVERKRLSVDKIRRRRPADLSAHAASLD